MERHELVLFGFLRKKLPNSTCCSYLLVKISHIHIETHLIRLLRLHTKHFPRGATILPFSLLPHSPHWRLAGLMFERLGKTETVGDIVPETETA